MIVIRTAEAKDIGSLIELLKTLFCIEEDFCCNAKLQQRGLEMLLASRKACVLVAEIDQKVVGMCTGQILISTAEGGAVALIEDVVIRKKHRGQGLGRLLMQGLSSWAKAQNASRLQLLADKNNQEALNFYKKIGWHNTQLICLRKLI